MQKPSARAGLVLVAAVAIAGCGGGEGNAEPEPPEGARADAAADADTSSSGLVPTTRAIPASCSNAAARPDTVVRLPGAGNPVVSFRGAGPDHQVILTYNGPPVAVRISEIAGNQRGIRVAATEGTLANRRWGTLRLDTRNCAIAGRAFIAKEDDQGNPLADPPGGYDRNGNAAFGELHGNSAYILATGRDGEGGDATDSSANR